jgi:CRISPR-associated protein Cas2
MKPRKSITQIGWLLALFDFPTLTKKERKIANEFRTNLLNDGYSMLQYSVYIRSCANTNQLEVHHRHIKTIIPETGNVRIIYLTDDQLTRSIVHIGKQYNNGNRANTTNIPSQIEFWE